MLYTAYRRRLFSGFSSQSAVTSVSNLNQEIWISTQHSKWSAASAGTDIPDPAGFDRDHPITPPYSRLPQRVWPWRIRLARNRINLQAEATHFSHESLMKAPGCWPIHPAHAAQPIRSATSPRKSLSVRLSRGHDESDKASPHVGQPRPCTRDAAKAGSSDARSEYPPQAAQIHSPARNAAQQPESNNHQPHDTGRTNSRNKQKNKTKARNKNPRLVPKAGKYQPR